MQKGKLDMQTLYRAKRPWDCIYVDFIQLDRSKTDKQYCLTVMDGYSRFLSVYPTARCRAIDAARQLMRHILMYDFPKIISSDQGRHFRSELLSELCNLLDIKQNPLSTAEYWFFGTGSQNFEEFIIWPVSRTKHVLGIGTSECRKYYE